MLATEAGSGCSSSGCGCSNGGQRYTCDTDFWGNPEYDCYGTCRRAKDSRPFK